MRVIGIDPGTLHAGYGVVEEKGGGFRYVASGAINAAGETVAARLAVIFRGLREAIEKYRPEAAAVENVW